MRDTIRTNGQETHSDALRAIAAALAERGCRTEPDGRHLRLIGLKTGRMVAAEVRALRGNNPGGFKRQLNLAREICIFALVPEDGPARFFPMTAARANELIREDLARLGRPDTYRPAGLTLSRAVPYEDAWDGLLPE